MDYENYVSMKEWSPSDFAKNNPGTDYYFRAELARFGFQCSGRRVLEIGFGNGAFLEFARSNGAEAVGVEVQEELLARAREAGFTVFREIDEVAEAGGRKFDLIAAFDVLEHLSPNEAIAFFVKLRSLVAEKDGLFIARFPNGDSPFSNPFQNGDYTHKMVLGRGIVHQILSRANWTMKYLGEPAWVAPTLRGRILLSIRNNLRWTFETLLKGLYYGTQGPPTLYYNYILAAVPAANARVDT